MLATHHLASLGFNYTNTYEGTLEYYQQELGWVLPLTQDLDKKIKGLIRPVDVSHVKDILLKTHKVWLLVTTLDQERGFRKFLKDVDWEKFVVHESIPTQNYKYSLPTRLLTLYILDLRNAT